MNLNLDSTSSQQTDEEIFHKPHWFAVYTKPRSEKKLKASLDKRGIQVYLPLLAQKKKWSDRWKIIETPLFSSYVFVKIVYSEDSLTVLKDPNSVFIVKFSGKPAIIEDDDIEMLEFFLKEFPDRLKIEEMEKLKPGKEVTIQRGPFAGRKAIVERIKNNVYIVLNLSAVGKSIRVELKKEDLDLGIG
jgi:transcriptional antiterminator RfaH